VNGRTKRFSVPCDCDYSLFSVELVSWITISQKRNSNIGNVNNCESTNDVSVRGLDVAVFMTYILRGGWSQANRSELMPRASAC